MAIVCTISTLKLQIWQDYLLQKHQSHTDTIFYCQQKALLLMFKQHLISLQMPQLRYVTVCSKNVLQKYITRR